jgi:hypothetical protein
MPGFHVDSVSGSEGARKLPALGEQPVVRDLLDLVKFVTKGASRHISAV